MIYFNNILPNATQCDTSAFLTNGYEERLSKTSMLLNLFMEESLFMV